VILTATRSIHYPHSEVHYTVIRMDAHCLVEQHNAKTLAVN